MKRKKIAAVIGGIFIALLLLGIAVKYKESPNKEPANKEPANKGWTLTQYGETEGNQSMFYTIQDQTGNLAVIDGGWADHADVVREVIWSLGGKVDTWILTHPHPDHIGAFNEIYQNLDGIKIKHIYAIEMDYAAYQKKAQPWDEFAVFDTFYKLSADMPQLQYLHEKEELEVLGLQLKMLNAYNDSVNQGSTDLANDGSMVFKLSGEQESILFCSDVGESRNDYLLENYKEELAADFIQMGHHGNSSMSDAFYQAVHPREAFFDAPDWLMKGKEERIKTPYYIQLMKDMGAAVLSFTTAPNQIVIH